MGVPRLLRLAAPRLGDGFPGFERALKRADVAKPAFGRRCDLPVGRPRESRGCRDRPEPMGSVPPVPRSHPRGAGHGGRSRAQIILLAKPRPEGLE